MKLKDIEVGKTYLLDDWGTRLGLVTRLEKTPKVNTYLGRRRTKGGSWRVYYRHCWYSPTAQKIETNEFESSTTLAKVIRPMTLDAYVEQRAAEYQRKLQVESDRDRAAELVPQLVQWLAEHGVEATGQTCGSEPRVTVNARQLVQWAGLDRA